MPSVARSEASATPGSLSTGWVDYQVRIRGFYDVYSSIYSMNIVSIKVNFLGWKVCQIRHFFRFAFDVPSPDELVLAAQSKVFKRPV